MPFKSQKQIEKFEELKKQGKMTQDKIDQWKSETKDIHKLPDRIHPKQQKVGRVKKI